jgi:hypothetical protein
MKLTGIILSYPLLLRARARPNGGRRSLCAEASSGRVGNPLRHEGFGCRTL